jgi:hypothetical protein
LQEKYFNLTVEDEGFSVFLSFNNNFQKIFIPYKSIINFFDPVANFKIDLSFIDYIDEQIIDKNNEQIVYLDF